MRTKINEDRLKFPFVIGTTFLIAFTFSTSFAIAATISLVVATMTKIATKRGNSKKSEKLSLVLPEIIDHMTSGIQSGLSLGETLSNLSERGPRESQEFFERFKCNLQAGISFEQSISILQDEMKLRGADQLFAKFIFANSSAPKIGLSANGV